MNWFYKIIKFIIGTIGILLYLYPFYEIVYLGKGLSLDMIKLWGLCWLAGMISIALSSAIRLKVDARKNFEGQDDYPRK